MGAERRTGRIAALALLLALALAAGCTNSDPLNSGVGMTTVRLQLVNGNTRFASVFYTIQEIGLVPLDPEAAEVQEAPLLLVSQLNALDLEQDQDTAMFQTSAELPDGLYRVTFVIIRNIDIRDGTSANDGTCKGSILAFTLAGGQPFPVMSGPFTLDIPGDLVVEAASSGSGVLEMVIDGSALVDAFVDNWLQCFEPPITFQIFPCVNLQPGCRPADSTSDSNFDVSGFQDAAPSYLFFP